MQIIQDKTLKRWPEYKSLRLKAFKDAPQAFLNDVRDADKLTQKKWQKRMKTTYFVEVDGKFVGMIGVYKDKHFKLRHILNIVGFYVLPEYRSKGYGKALFKFVLDKFENNKSIKKFQLGVIETQTRAYKMYLSFGFKKVGELKYAIKVGDKFFDEYFLEKYLQ